MSQRPDASKGGSGFLPGLLLGGAIGAAVALLWAPRPGRAQREALAQQGIELSGHLDEVFPGTTAAIQERGQKLLDEQRARFQRATEEARRATERAREELTRRYEAAKRTGSA